MNEIQSKKCHTGPALNVKGKLRSIFVLVMFLLSSCSKAAKDTVEQSITFKPSNISIIAEAPTTVESFQRGLKFRTRLDEKRGMIFNFGVTWQLSFWMHDTRIPLEIIFLDMNLKIVDIQEMEPCTESDPSRCPVYPSKKPAMYAVEVNKDFSKRYGIREGDFIVVNP